MTVPGSLTTKFFSVREYASLIRPPKTLPRLKLCMEQACMDRLYGFTRVKDSDNPVLAIEALGTMMTPILCHCISLQNPIEKVASLQLKG